MKVVLICDICGSHDSRVVLEPEVLSVRGVEISTASEVRVCVCGNELFDEELENANLSRAYDRYRDRFGVMTSGEIKETREGYGLSQRGMARLLGWGEITIHRYESGALPDTAHAKLLTALKNPVVMQELLLAGKDAIPAAMYDRAVSRIGGMLRDLNRHAGESRVGTALSEVDPDVYSGYRRFNLEKFTQVLLFFAQKSPPLTKTKLNKLLFCADFHYFRSNTVSITGARYLKYEYGPVPQRYDSLIEELADSGVITVTEEPVGPYMGTVVRPAGHSELSLLSDDELATLRMVVERYGRHSASMVSEVSHQEHAWRETDPRQPIEYTWAQSLL